MAAFLLALLAIVVGGVLVGFFVGRLIDRGHNRAAALVVLAVIVFVPALAGVLSGGAS